ncbi:hypothetical protein PCIT_a4223 [Pseudoalteromonas citrea]|uniref:HTH lysR-type domain-containing protein n=2 Tax=Pseudoalteromonas citrea TaxID=43655 RepID=A0AAD4FRU5_9GAMM|nr:LysR substrate-binding domain-containing protein [Pseudoalteromonas citrea]KAF7771171.1 hypothetical protein PCIT_a4223 [Pseudoalteromonas citrea]
MHKALNNLNLLRTFNAAAHHASYSLAASELCISQAAVSQQMRQLQSLLGQQLFTRKGKSMLLTQSGEVLFLATNNALSVLTESLDTITKQPLEGPLTISSTQAFSAIWLIPRLHLFSKLHPEITINIQSSAGFDDLTAQHIDLAIRFGKNVRQKTPKEYECLYFGDGTVHPVCSVSMLEELKNTDDISARPLINIGSSSPYDWLEWAKHHGVSQINENTAYTSVSSTDMALTAVLNSNSIALIVDYLCQNHIDSGELCIAFALPHPNKVERYFVYDKRSPKHERIHVFIEWVKTQMAEEAGQ